MVDHDDPFDGGIQQRVQLFNRTIGDMRELCMPGSGTRASEIAPVRCGAADTDEPALQIRSWQRSAVQGSPVIHRSLRAPGNPTAPESRRLPRRSSVERMRQTDDRGDQRAAPAVRWQAAGEYAVDLKSVNRQLDRRLSEEKPVPKSSLQCECLRRAAA